VLPHSETPWLVVSHAILRNGTTIFKTGPGCTTVRWLAADVDHAQLCAGNALGVLAVTSRADRSLKSAALNADRGPPSQNRARSLKQVRGHRSIRTEITLATERDRRSRPDHGSESPRPLPTFRSDSYRALKSGAGRFGYAAKEELVGSGDLPRLGARDERPVRSRL
jgi:hypothetical protein